MATPAHVAIYPGKDGKWKLSNFLDDFKDLDWRIRHSYSVNCGPQDDICWAKYPGDDSDALVLEDTDIKEPTKSYVMFRQPYDMDAVWVSQSEMGLTEAILYRSPRRDSGDFPESDERPMLESMDIGFRGMSGAIAVNGNGRCLRMLVKRGKLIPLKAPRSAVANALPVVADALPQPSWLEQLLFSSLYAGFDRLDARFDRLDAEVLKKDDLPELAAVFDARRGLFIPSTNILSIDDSKSISVKTIIGDKALEIPRF